MLKLAHFKNASLLQTFCQNDHFPCTCKFRAFVSNVRPHWFPQHVQTPTDEDSLAFCIFVTHEIHQEKGEEKKEISMKIANLISYSWQPQKIGVTVEITIAVFRQVFLLLSLSWYTSSSLISQSTWWVKSLPPSSEKKISFHLRFLRLRWCLMDCRSHSSVYNWIFTGIKYFFAATAYNFG